MRIDKSGAHPTIQAAIDAEVFCRGLQMRLFPIEHLTAIMLQTGSAKGRTKTVRLVALAGPNYDQLEKGATTTPTYWGMVGI
jgi:hypothetical protein